MNSFSCCSACSGSGSGEGLNKLFSMGSYVPETFSTGSYVPETPGYPQTYSFPTFKPMGVAGPLMGQNIARPYPGAPGPVFADQGNPDFPRSNGDANPFYKLSKVMPAVNPLGRQVQTGFVDRFNPVGAYATTGNPFKWDPAGAGFQPMGAYPSASNPMGITPVGENMPAQIGHPARMGQGIGGEVQSLGFMV